MSRAVYLCGFMGCGKTTVGRVLADLLGTAYADMDAYIEKSEKMSIPQIFSDKGEGYFRDAETRAVEEMGKNGGVIACGGGAMLREKNADLAAKNGVVVYIDTPYDICWERIKDDANRPIVAVNTKESLGEFYEKRKALYTAHSAFRADGTGSPSQIAAQIAEFIKKVNITR